MGMEPEMETELEFVDLFKFDKFVAPVLIKVIYWIGIVLIVLSTLAGLTGVSLFDRYVSTGFNFGHALLVLIFGALFLLVWRVLCELWIVIFSINEKLSILAGLKNGKPAP
jgi:hypothetical protein